MIADWSKSTLFELPVILNFALWSWFCVTATLFDEPTISKPKTLSLPIWSKSKALLSPFITADDVKSVPIIKLSSPSCNIFKVLPSPVCVIYI